MLALPPVGTPCFCRDEQAEAVASFGLTAEGPAFEAPSDGGLALSLPELSLPELPSF